MKSTTLVLALMFATACGKKSPEAPTAATMMQPVAAPEACTVEMALQCAEGLVDGCSLGLTTGHACVAADAQPGADCTQEVVLNCPAGQVDACTTAAAITHVCVMM